MTKVNWREILLANEDKVKDGIRRAYELACDGNQGVIYVAEVDTEGNISIGEYIGSGSQSYESWKGIAVEVARIEAFDSMDGDDFSYFPKDDCELTDEEKAGFVKWAQEREENPQNPYLLQEWEAEVWNRWRTTYKDNYLEGYVDDYVEEQFERLTEDIEVY